MKVRAAFFTLVFFSMSLVTFAQTSRGTVSGTVTDPTGQPRKRLARRPNLHTEFQNLQPNTISNSIRESRE